MAWIARFALVVVGTGVYLGLAVLGGGGVAVFFANPARTAVAVVTAALAVVGMWAGGNLSAGVREDRGNRWVMAALSLIGLVDAYLPAWSDRAEVWTLGGEGVRWLGVLLLAAGG